MPFARLRKNHQKNPYPTPERKPETLTQQGCEARNEKTSFPPHPREPRNFKQSPIASPPEPMDPPPKFPPDYEYA